MSEKTGRKERLSHEGREKGAILAGQCNVDGTDIRP